MQPTSRRGDSLPSTSQGACAIRFALTCILLSPISLLACHGMLLVCQNEWIIIVAGIALCVVAGVLMAKGHRKSPAFLWTAILFNTVATGISLAAYFAWAEMTPTFWDYSAIIPYGLLLLLSAAVFGAYRMPKAVKIVYAILIVLIPAGSIAAIFILKDYKCFLSVIVYFSVIWAIQTAFLYLSSRDTTARLYNLGFASFGWYAVITFIVLLLITQGEMIEACDCCDCGDCGRRKKR